MAYALRYYKELTHADGTVIRLEIYKKDSTTSAVEIGAVVQRLSLEIQGQQDDIDSPIQKTSLHMTFVDASDIENGQKNGFWQEFYTPDALMWKVILKAKDAKETEFRTIWGGYVTPDSFSEDLVYRGSVSITARDNIGHMQDFPFDAEGDADGMISLYNLVESGWEKIHSPMMLEWRGAAESTMWLMCDGVSAMFTLMNVSMFEGMDWYKAIETALASYGVVMRYVGNNIVKMSSLRSMPYQGEELIEDLIHIEPTFVSGATRELIPAVKRIEESVDYDFEEIVFEKLPQSSFTGDIERFEVAGVTYEKSGIAWTIDKKESGSGWCCPRNSMFFNADQYPFFQDEDGDARYNFLVCNTYGLEGSVGYRYAEYSRPYYFPATLTFDLRLGRPYMLNTNGNLMPYYQLENVSVAVIVEYLGASYYLQKDGSWDTVAVSHVLSSDNLSLQIPAADFTGRGMMKIQIHHIKTSSNSKGIGQYIPLYSATLTHSMSLREKNTVNTNYDASNNVILSRDPEIGPAFDKVALPRIIKNGIFYRQGDVILPARKWSWGSGSEQQMAVWNHLQLLSYYAKPNNLISGTIVNADITRAKAIYMWHGAEHILISGTYNFLNGHIESAMLREFARYEDMWSEVAGADMPDTEQDSRSNVEGGSASGGSSSTYSNTTTVNIGSGGGGGTGASYLNDLLDVDTTGVVAQSVLYYNGTSWVDMSLPTLLNPYLKADIAAQTYAKSSDLSALTTRVGANEGSIASLQSGKADKATTLAGYGIKDAYTTTQIDAKVQTINNALALRYTKSEVDAIVETINDALADRYTKKQTDSAISTALASYYTKNEIDGKVTTINNALADRYTKTQVDGIVTTINNSITSVDNKYASTKTWADTLASLIVNENGNIRIKTNLIINGDTASGGGSGETAIGITGILLNGTTYRDENGDGIIDLGTITSGLTSVNWSDVQGRPTSLSQFNNDLGLGTLAYKNGLTASDVGALSTSGGTIESITQNLLTINNSASDAKNSYQYFSLKGEKKGRLGYNAEHGRGMHIYNEVSKAFLGINDDGTPIYSGNTLYHTGNFNPADYLPLSGGTISKASNEPLMINNTTAGGGCYIDFMVNSAMKAYVGYSSKEMVFMQLAAGSYLGVKKDGAYYGSNPLIHSGNIGSYKSGSANILATTYAENINYAAYTTELKLITYNADWEANGFPKNWTSGLSVMAGYTGWQLVTYGGSSDTPYFRKVSDAGTWSNWRALAFTDSNVAGAYKLVDASGNDAVTIGANKELLAKAAIILGNSKSLAVTSTDNTQVAALYMDGNNNLLIGKGTNTKGAGIYMYGSKYFFKTTTSETNSLIINESGNVTIGSSDKASTSYKLYVSGNTCIGYNGIYGEGNESMLRGSANAISIGYGYRNLTTDIYGGTIRFYRGEGTTSMVINSSGNVLIGTTTDDGSGAKLQVNGDISIPNNNKIVGIGTDKSAYSLVRLSGTNEFIVGDNRVITQVRSSMLRLSYGSSNTIGILMNSSGNVTIGASDLAGTGTKLYVDGTGRFTGTLTVGGASTFNGDVRINGNLIVTGDISA